ncbi:MULTISPECIES: DUF4347 domain-containing protein [Cyanobium]|uniref:DUF4347 domain-containing protein n=1 Tax=Cyanobium usitatum str. Tous TaxID=2116684 RepID=A0A2P7MXS1_9CYAN|nr:MULTISPECIES: DUF4347 domain-containing protein [Cyanobium]MCP9780196.1 DUF4347 domain-containing protein [Cyanobium sp. To12R1]PSJ06006.1 hypothetical protein C7K55_06140 [Cyanobium usitatum str. Tous]
MDLSTQYNPTTTGWGVTNTWVEELYPSGTGIPGCDVPLLGSDDQSQWLGDFNVEGLLGTLDPPGEGSEIISLATSWTSSWESRPWAEAGAPALDLITGVASSAPQPPVVRELLILDAGVDALEELRAGVKAGVAVAVLDGARDGVEQINELLAGYSTLDALHIVSHGSEGSLQLGSTQLNSANLARYATDLQQWGTALASGGDLMVYGCDLAAGPAGQSFLQQLSALTGADVAASDDPTGSALLGGDWDLERTTGAIESGLAFSDSLLATYQSVLAETLSPQVEAGIASGLNTLEQFANSISQLEALTTDLPIVGKSISSVLNLGQRLNDELLQPIKTYLAAYDPADSAALVAGLNALLPDPIQLIDESTAGVVRIRVQGLSFSATKEDIQASLGAEAETLGLDLGAGGLLDFTPTIAMGGTDGFVIGFDLDPTKAPGEAFFVDFTGASLNVSVETPFANKTPGETFDFDVELGMLGGVKVVDGSFDLNANIAFSFADPTLTANDILGSAISSLVTVTPTASFNATLNVSASLGGESVGSGQIGVALTGDAFSEYDIDVTVSNQSLKNFSNITPGDVVSALSELGNNLQALASSFNLPGGIPFVEDQIADILDFAAQLQDLTKQLFDLGLQGGTEFLASALSSNATFQVVVDGVASGLITVYAGTSLAGLVAAVQAQLPAGLEASLDNGRLAIRTTGDGIESLKFSNVNAVAQAAFGFADSQSALPFYDFVTFQDLEALINPYLPAGFSITYDPLLKTIGFDLELFGQTQADVELNFTKDIDLGGLATLSLAGGGTASVDAAARLKLAAAFDLTPLSLSTKITDLNGGLGIRTNTGVSPDLNFQFANGTTGAVDLDVPDVLAPTATVADLIAALTSQTAGRLAVEINFTQDGLILRDTTHTPSTTNTFKVAFAPGSAAALDLGFGIGVADVDDNGRLDGSTIISRLFLKPYDSGTGAGSSIAAGFELSATDLHLGASLGILEVGVTGGTSAPIQLAIRGALLDPDGSGSIYLPELSVDPAASLALGFGTYAGGANLSGAFTPLAVGDELGSFDLGLSFDCADTYGIDLGGELAAISVKLKVESISSLVPLIVPDVDIDAGSLPNFSAILESFENLSIPQLLALVADIVEKFKDLPLISTQLPLLDQSIGDLVSFISDKIDTIVGDFSTMQDDLSALLEATINGLQAGGSVNGQPLGAALVALGSERQELLFHALEHLDGAIQAVPADLNLLFDGGSPKILALAAAFRSLREVVQVIDDEVPAAQAVVDYFSVPVTSGVPALASRSFFRQVSDLLPSGDRIVQVLMKALGLELLDLSDPANAAILTAISEAQAAADLLITNVPSLPSGDLGPLSVPRDAAQDDLDSALAALGSVSVRLGAAITDQNVFAALRAVSDLADAISGIQSALKMLVNAADPIFDIAISELKTFLSDVISGVRSKVFEAFPLGALTFSLPEGGKALQIDLHVARSITEDVVVEVDLDTGLPDFVPLNFNGAIAGQINLLADFRFGFGIDLDDSSLNYLDPYLAADSEVALSASLDLAITADATIGGLTLGITDGFIKLNNTIDLGADNAVGGADVDADTYGDPVGTGAILALGLNDPTPGDGRVYFPEIAAAIDPRLEAALLVYLPVDVNGTTFDIFAQATLNNFTDFDFTISDLPQGLIDEIVNGLTELNLANILAGLKTLLGALESGLKSDLISQIPGIGDDLSSVGDVLGDVNGFITEFETWINNTLGVVGLTADNVLALLKKFLFDTLGPGATTGTPEDLLPSFTPLNILFLNAATDGVNTSVLDWEDIPLTFTGAGNLLNDADAGFDFDLEIGFNKTIEVPLDFGFEGMGLELDSDALLNLSITPSLGLAFGLTRSQGFYVDLDRTGGELLVDAYLDESSSLDLKLWFLDLSATVAPVEDMNHDGDADDTLDEVADRIDYNRDGVIDNISVAELGDSDSNGEITGGVGIFGAAALSFGTGKLTFNDLENFAPNFDFTAKADLDLFFEAALAGQQALPDLEALLDIDWNFSLDNPSNPANLPEVRFANVRLDLGDFFRDNVAPVIAVFEDYLQPLQAIFDVVNAEIPVISELAELLGQDPVTFLDLVGLLGSGFDDVAKYIETLDNIVDIITTITGIASGLGSGYIEFGDLSLPDVDVTKASSRSAIKSFDNPTALSADAAAILSQLGGVTEGITALKAGKTSTSSTGVTNGQFFFPIIDQPFGTLAGLLLGQTRDLVVWDLPDFVAEFNYKQLFGPILPPVPLFVSIFGNFEFATDFAIGFDTRGIQKSFADFYQGFYLRDWADDDNNGILDDGETTEARELGLDLEFGAGAELNVVVASAGVEGGISASITADWHDVNEDGKFYIDELGQRLEQGIECIFELSGKLEAFLRAFVKLGFDTPFGFVTLFEESLDLLNVTLLDFSVSCPPLPIPQPGRWEDPLTQATIILNIGPEAGQRQPGATDIAETVEVFGERLTDDDPDTDLRALDAGIIDSDGDGDIDSDDVGAWVAGGNTLDVLIDLNSDNKIDTDEARLLEDFNRNGTICTTEEDKRSVLLIGFGQWQLFLDNATLIRGDGGAEDDQILFDHSVWVAGDLSGGAGKDNIVGGQGNDLIEGGDEEDILIGGFGNDTIRGDAGDDQIFGNAGIDDLSGGEGNDNLFGDNGDNIQPFVLDLQGDPVAPETLVLLSSLGDTLRGGGGEDNLFGEWGNDKLYGESGPDQLSGGQGDDELYGGNDPDLLEGNEGSDKIYGEAGNDLLFGEADSFATNLDGDDLLDGGTENDTLRDDYGNDTAIGGFGDDFIVTGIGNDVIFGDVDPRVAGSAPAGYSGMDTIYADRDGLPITDDGFGLGNGNDYVEGGANADTIFSGAGNDRVIGGSSPFSAEPLFTGLDGADLIYAQDGDDIIAGDNAKIGTAGDASSAATVQTYAEGGAGIDIIYGGSGKDWIFGGGAGDKLYGDEAGGADDDIVVGDQGSLSATKLEALHSAIVGSGGADQIYGYGGDDILLGGDDSDLLVGNLGNDLLVGDNGTVTLALGVVNRVETRDPSFGGDDQIYGDAGSDIAFGGIGDDFIYGGGDNNSDGGDILFGDHGVAAFLDNSADENDLFSTDPTYGGEDFILGGFGDDIIVGGSGGDDNTPTGGDLLYGNSGNDVIAGDNVRIDRTDNSALPSIQKIYSLFTSTGGDDRIWGGTGSDVAIGGFGNDEGHGEDGSDILLGDNGEVIFNDASAPDPASLDIIRSTALDDGGIDILTGDEGNDVIIGGSKGDTLYGDDATASHGVADGDDVLLGDNAEIFLAGTSGRLLVQVVGMAAPSAIDRIASTDIIETTGGADTIEGNAGNDLIIGGVNNGDMDKLYGDADTAKPNLDGIDVILGDSGLVEFGLEGTPNRNSLDRVRSHTDETPDGLGGADLISGNAGADLAMGGTGGDAIYGDDDIAAAADQDGSDTLLGDNGVIDLAAMSAGASASGDELRLWGGSVALIRTTDSLAATGGQDTIEGNAAGDRIAGGVDRDSLYGDAITIGSFDGNDTILGDNGSWQWLSDGDLAKVPEAGLANPGLVAGFSSVNTNITTLDLVTTEGPAIGDRDTIEGDAGSDWLFGGTGADLIYGDDTDGSGPATNNDLIFGDHGRIYPQFSVLPAFPSRNFFSIDTGDTAGGEGDQLFGEEGSDILLGQQGDDRIFGGSGDDDMIGGHNVSGGFDELTSPQITAELNPPVNDLMDGGSGNDAMAGDNATIWRRGDDLSPRFRALNNAAGPIYNTSGDGASVTPTITTNVGTSYQSDPNDVVGRDIRLLDHSDAVELNPLGRFGADVIAGGADKDLMFGQLGNDLIAGDGFIGADDLDANSITHTLTVTDSVVVGNTDQTLYLNIPELASDGDDYIEGNGGSDLIYGGLGQDDIIGGSSSLFGLDAEQLRPDGADIIFGGAGNPVRLTRNDFVGSTDTDTGTAVGTGALPTGDDPRIALEDRHSRDSDFILGDNGNIFRLVKGGASGTNPTDAKDTFLSFNYDLNSSFENRGTNRIVVRAMQQLDYTLGGADRQGGSYANGAANADNGAGDLIHGESGDDFIYGMTGSDVLFGESDDDDLIGGYGNDWISGGTGQDGVLGDDGLLFTSRNNSTVGEGLYGIAALLTTDPNTKYSNGNVLNEVISTPGTIQLATINVGGQLKKTAELTPFSFDPYWAATDDEFPDNEINTPFADDIIFGGLDSDFLHGGSGDDAISGAEALEHAYVPLYNLDGTLQGTLQDLGYNAFTLTLNPGASVTNPNPGDVLSFFREDADGRHLNNRFRAGEFDLYDEYDPLRKVLLDGQGNLRKSAAQGTAYEFLLNFDSTEGLFRAGGTVPKATGQQTESYLAVNDDGNDAIFGDLGNDWLVGGTGRDNLYGGWGNDLLNVDDNQSTNGNRNDTPDTHPTYEDRAYGGAGRDLLIANTGGDRLIDWVGEYNSYLVPFAPFGMATVSRTLQPTLPEFLYALSAGDGADPSRYRDAVGPTPPTPTNNDPNPSRNGEPFGELGLVLQKDFAWRDQTGAPADPQAGNIPGGKRDVLRSADFNDGTAQGMFVDAGTWTVSGGSYQVAPASAGADALSVYNPDVYIPSYFEVLATINAVKPTGGTNANGYLIFDYYSSTDFKFAGINVSTNKLEIGRRTASGWIVDKQAAFTSSLKSGIDYNLFLAVNGSVVTLTVNNATTLSFTFAARIDASGTQHRINEGMLGLGARNAKSSIDNLRLQRIAPTFSYDKALDFSTAPPADQFQAPLQGNLSTQTGRYVVTSGSTPTMDLVNMEVASSSTLQLTSKLSTTGQGGFVFDYYSATDYKFVTIDAKTGKLLIGHVTNSGTVIDATINSALIKSGTDLSLGVTLQGSTIAVSLNGQQLLSRSYNALLTDGEFGLFSINGATSFDIFQIQTTSS